MSSVDVVVPCYNYAKYLEFCVRSVLSQRDVNVRVLILDDVSPDNTPEVAGRLAASDGRVTYVRNEENLGLVGTANKGVMNWAAAEYVVLLSADDALTPGSLSRATQLMEARPDVVLTYGMALILQDDGPELTTQDTKDPPSVVISGKEFLRLTCEQGNPVPSPAAVMRMSAQRGIGGYNPKYKHTCDVDMWIRAAAAGPIGVINTVQAYYRWHSSNMSAAYQLRPVGDRAEMLENCADFLEKNGREFPDFRQWLEQMRHRFGDEALLIASKAFENEGDGTWRTSLEIAKRWRPDYWRSPTWWKFLFKRMLGQRSTARLQNWVDRLGVRPVYKHVDWWEHGVLNGRWPGNASRQG
jgi:glycosyltransferase involved in cell wall biosynthesis